MMSRFAVLTLTLALAACASVIHGSSQDVGIASTPTHARITIDNTPRGETPTVVKLSRKDHHIVKLELAGYQPFETTLTRSVSGWVWGNIVFGGVVGLAVDAITGGLYKLTPEQVTGQLRGAVTPAGRPPRSGAARSNGEGLYVAVVLRPDPTWQRVGTLAKK